MIFILGHVSQCLTSSTIVPKIEKNRAIPAYSKRGKTSTVKNYSF